MYVAWQRSMELNSLRSLSFRTITFLNFKTTYHLIIPIFLIQKIPHFQTTFNLRPHTFLG